VSGRQSLAGAFAPAAPPARGARLEGLLAPKKRGRGTPAPEPTIPPVSEEPAAPVLEPEAPVAEEPAAAPEADQQSAPEADQQSVAETVTAPVPEAVRKPAVEPKTTPRQPAKKATAAKKASETVPGALRNVGVYLPPQLLADVKDAVYRDRTTYADLLIDAFEALTDEQIAGEFATEAATTGAGMPRRAPRKRGEAGIQIQLRLDGLQIAWLDGKVTEFDAPSRSALVSAVFKLHVYQAEDPETGE
jgi:hypothetical protein